MPRSVPEQVVVIAGASTGIGRATALAFAARGARVVCMARGEEALGTLVAQIRAAGGSAVAVPADITDAAAVRAVAETAEQTYGRIDTWVNAAAVGVWARLEDVTPDEFDRVVRVNVTGHLNGVHAALPALRRAGGGVVIGISSAEGLRAVPLQGPYVASKFALRGLYDTLRMELAHERTPIAVTTILPSSADTPFFEHARSKLGVMVKPPPPVYAPEVVAASIVYAAEHPRREIPVGAAAFGLYAAQRLSPALAEAVLSVRQARRGPAAHRPPGQRRRQPGPSGRRAGAGARDVLRTGAAAQRADPAAGASAAAGRAGHDRDPPPARRASRQVPRREDAVDQPGRGKLKIAEGLRTLVTALHRA